MFEIVGYVDRSPFPATELALDRVAVDEGGLQAGQQLGHAAGSVGRDNPIIGTVMGRGQRL